MMEARAEAAEESRASIPSGTQATWQLNASTSRGSRASQHSQAAEVQQLRAAANQMQRAASQHTAVADELKAKVHILLEHPPAHVDTCDRCHTVTCTTSICLLVSWPDEQAAQLITTGQITAMPELCKERTVGAEARSWSSSVVSCKHLNAHITMTTHAIMCGRPKLDPSRTGE